MFNERVAILEKKYQILMVEDSLSFQELIIMLLKPMAQITVASTTQEALDIVDKKSFDLILMDVMLEDGDGFTLTSQMREKKFGKDVPVIFITSKGHIDDKTIGFKLGAEDYIVKPFDPRELRLRIESRLQKIGSGQSQNQLTKGNIHLEIPLQKVLLIKENKALNLTPLEFKILFYLMNNEQQVVGRDKLSSEIWGLNTDAGRSIDAHVTSLRKKLGDDSACIQSVYGAGYVFKIDC